MPDTPANPASAPALLSARGIHKHYPIPEGVLKVLQGIDLELQQGSFTAVVGASGSGKSTLLHVLGGLDRPTGGEVTLAGRLLGGLADEQRAEIRNRLVGFVFQFHHLLPEFSALENVALPAQIAGIDRSRALRTAGELLDRVGLQMRADHRPSRLSGGEQQRVALARALVNAPPLLLADEPSGNLDRASSERLHELLGELNQQHGQTILIVTHDPVLAARATRVLELTEGRLGEIR